MRNLWKRERKQGYWQKNFEKKDWGQRLIFSFIMSRFIIVPLTLFKKFPFQSTLLRDLRTLNPSERRSFKDFPAAVVHLAKRFSQLDFSETCKLEELKAEAIDFQIADTKDLPTDTDISIFWPDLHKSGSIGTTPVYAKRLVLVRALLSLPGSNADRERTFSMVWKIDTEDRSHLKCSTVASLLTLM